LKPLVKISEVVIVRISLLPLLEVIKIVSEATILIIVKVTATGIVVIIVETQLLYLKAGTGSVIA
jgi:hypothetical protein